MFAGTADRRRGGPPSTEAARWLAIGALVIAAAANASEGAMDGDAANAPAVLVARALAYEHGEGVPKNPLKAAVLYCAAARAGDAEAQFSLGWMYANGRGVATTTLSRHRFSRLPRRRGTPKPDECCASLATMAAHCPIACDRPNLRRASRTP
jgi:TPR repeat protein